MIMKKLFYLLLILVTFKCDLKAQKFDSEKWNWQLQHAIGLYNGACHDNEEQYAQSISLLITLYKQADTSLIAMKYLAMNYHHQTDHFNYEDGSYNAHNSTYADSAIYWINKYFASGGTDTHLYLMKANCDEFKGFSLSDKEKKIAQLEVAIKDYKEFASKTNDQIKIDRVNIYITELQRSINDLKYL